MLSKKSFWVIALDCTGLRLGSRFCLCRSLDPPWEFSQRVREPGRNGWPGGMDRQGPEVLYDRCEMEFVTRTGEPSQPHAFKSVVGLEVSKTHLNALTFIP